MTDHPDRAREELAAEAERLRQQRLDAERAREQRQQAQEQAAARDRQSWSAGRVRSSLSRGWLLWAAGMLAALGLATYVTAGKDEDGTYISASRERAEHLLGAGLLAAAGLLVLHRVTARARWRLWRARLPFRLEGFEEALGGGLFVRTAQLELHFQGIAAQAEVVRELLTARVGEGHAVDGSLQVLLVRSPEFSSEVANWPAAGWYRRVCRRVLLDIHRAYPLERAVCSAAAKVDYDSGGD